ncbi:MAG: response regulator [Phycisphaerales bacterium]|nr:response regulator [Phycisphaerales bacterium]
MPNSRSRNPTPAPARAPARIRVLCVDDSRDITEQLGQCIAMQPDMESVGSLSSANNLRAELEKLRPDVVLLDIAMPGVDPLEAVRELTDAARAVPGASPGGSGCGAARVIVFSGSGDKKAVVSAADAGAWGFVCKDAEIPVILGAIREVACGKVAFGRWL